MKATKNDRDLRLSAKNTAKKYFSDLREEMLFGEELIEFIRASVLWEKDEGFHVRKFYEYIAEEIMEMYFRIYQTCSCCYKQFYKKDMRYEDNIGYCIECYNKKFEEKKKDVKTIDNNNITKFNAMFGDRYEIMTRRDVRKITQNMHIKIRCKKCEAIFLKKLANVFRLDEEKELCECSKSSGKKNILVDSDRGRELLLLEKRELEKKRKRAQRKRKKEELKAIKLEEEKRKREL